ncbi:MAG: sulfatase-like hydrolase/transferase, partial [Proteobacteria bacterium]|nr:sulfatase-like hydrolase/transferase [Pseudomonadota bacterium]
MRAMRRISRLALAVALGGLTFPAARADELPARHAPTGPALPLPPPAFHGTIGESYASSTPDLARARRAPAGAPNVLVVLTDDVGFGAASTFGGPVPTPNLDRLAARGLIYNRFHTTAMCS